MNFLFKKKGHPTISIEQVGIDFFVVTTSYKGEVKQEEMDTDDVIPLYHRLFDNGYEAIRGKE